MNSFTGNVRGAVIGAVALAVLAPVAAIAAPASDLPAAMVSYADLDLGTPGGAAKLHTRVLKAARTVCQYNANARELWELQSQRACMSKALNSADVQIAALMQKSDGGTSFALREEPVRR